VPDHDTQLTRPARLAALGTLAGLALIGVAGCGQGGGTGGGSTVSGSAASGPAGYGVLEAAPTPSAQPTPAQAAGGSCQLLDYGAVEQATGTRFAVAASTASGSAQSCALQTLYSDYPDLLLSAAPTKADAKTFGKAAPDNASTVSGLGQAAYSRRIAAGDGAGPAVQVDWLGKNAKLLTLRYTFPPGTATATATAFTPKLIAVAKAIEAKR
jgi:hypothetical protein